ncbi:MAG: polysaccharide deacetylase family protein [Calditrichaeota bacterium]|nr:polysaccharide deacetylase family protein [Calditrichota bacterium]
MRYLIFLLLFTVLSASGQEIALTFDDAPRNDTQLFSGQERSKKLIENLKKAQVPDALFFVVTGQINEQNHTRLNDYMAAGFHLANHSHSHWSADRTEIEKYLADIAKADSILQKFENFIPLFRYPYLHEGKTRETRDPIRNYLDKHGYNNGYVTIDNYDWYMDHLLQRALKEGKQVNYEILKDLYINTLWQAITFYDDIALKTLGRSPKHVLLLHENDLAALFIADLVKYIRAQSWKIISPQEAYTDPIASTIPDVLFNNQGRVAAIAKSEGWKIKDLILDSEDEKYLDDLFESKKVFR